MKALFSRQLFDALPIIGILRGFSRPQLKEIVIAALRGGLTNLEITMNTPEAARQIQEASALAAGRINIGAGTVISPALLEEARGAGASFMVTPTLNDAVVDRCVADEIPVFPEHSAPMRWCGPGNWEPPW